MSESLALMGAAASMISTAVSAYQQAKESGANPMIWTDYWQSVGRELREDARQWARDTYENAKDTVWNWTHGRSYGTGRPF